MSDSDNNFNISDSSSSESENDNVDEDFSDYELNEEDRRTIYNATLENRDIEVDDAFFEGTEKKEKKRRKKINTNKGLNWGEFQQKVEDIENKNKPKKWVSGRKENRKSTNPVKKEYKKVRAREFNPRLAPPDVKRYYNRSSYNNTSRSSSNSKYKDNNKNYKNRNSDERYKKKNDS